MMRMPKPLAKAHTANTSESDDIEWRSSQDGENVQARHHAVQRAASAAHGH
jgi:hypothetical protein